MWDTCLSSLSDFSFSFFRFSAIFFFLHCGSWNLIEDFPNSLPQVLHLTVGLEDRLETGLLRLVSSTSSPDSSDSTPILPSDCRDLSLFSRSLSSLVLAVKMSTVNSVQFCLGLTTPSCFGLEPRDFCVLLEFSVFWEPSFSFSLFFEVFCLLFTWGLWVSLVSMGETDFSGDKDFFGDCDRLCLLMFGNCLSFKCSWLCSVLDFSNSLVFCLFSFSGDFWLELLTSFSFSLEGWEGWVWNLSGWSIRPQERQGSTTVSGVLDSSFMRAFGIRNIIMWFSFFYINSLTSVFNRCESLALRDLGLE